ncbi:hypothetical protein JQ612_14000 [Bradyrhizobium manausense]|uniref:hypothetical protein n=1 Tax=Bradyrhizobium manausense TaxID=989370 RepID=UPI001BA5434C|nr:hypothetical protein [Bradyrhizobium manausense]MBR0685217.1 hypothetical protein [Bradyrhizobium manausense]MBR0721209.1 hypothetical protein [Bradyrhizobium manausense]MBR0834301.1 hypothetical protein [Bradyrhizobium manausense]
MPDPEMAALLRAVLDEVCAEIPLSDTTTRERVAARLRKAAQTNRHAVQDLRQAARDALIRAPTMWR